MGDKFSILVINPGSTSTKIAVYLNEQCLWEKEILHSLSELKSFKRIIDQYPYREKIILEVLKTQGFSLSEFDALVGRGGFLKALPSGTYQIDQKMIEDIKFRARWEHASNLGVILAFQMGSKLGIPAFTVDPVVVDELDSLARISGIPEIERKSISHTLNLKATARRAARDLNKEYESINLIVVHLGGGISVTAHRQGRMVDVNNALLGEGPFSPQRAGSLPIGELVELCYSGEYSYEELIKRLAKEGGLIAYLGTDDGREVERRIKNGDQKARLIYEAMAYQIAKEIGAMATVLEGRVEAIILTGGLAKSKVLVDWIIPRVSFLAPVLVYPGQMEMGALAQGALRVLEGREKARIYE